MLIVALLSRYMLIGLSISTCNSFGKVLIHTSSQMCKVIAQNPILTLWWEMGLEIFYGKTCGGGINRCVHSFQDFIELS